MSNGIGIQYSIPITDKLRKLNRKFSRQVSHSNNWYKTLVKINKEYSRINNVKKDIRCKIVTHMKSMYGTLCFQDENVKAWQRIWGKKIMSTNLGGTISMLKQKVHTPVEVDRMFHSTKTCSKCGNIKDMSLNDRVYACGECDNVMDRDHNSSINIMNEGLKQIGTVRTELMPEEIDTSTLTSLRYFNSIPYVRARSVYEPGSLIASA